MRSCAIEVFHGGVWHRAGLLERASDGEGRHDPTWLEYDVDYAADRLGARDARALSVRLPVDFSLTKVESFPAFAIDLLPQGEARRVLQARLRDEGVRASEWALLTHGAGNPVGNLRIAEAVKEAPPAGPGVTREDVAARGESFHRWALDEGIPMTGSTDTSGASPKLLLTEDEQGKLHADGVLPDARAQRHFIVKFPRGRTTQDRRVLDNEAPYLEVLRGLGLRCHAALELVGEALFVPRFDRVRLTRGLERRGLESAYSILGVVDAGARLAYEDVARAVAAEVDQPERDVIELVLRDAAALALGNTDNHGRNTSLCKREDGTVELSPVYDFAPMILDPEMIRRRTCWRSEPPSGGIPDWSDVCASLDDVVAREVLAPALRAMGEALEEVEPRMREAGVDEELIIARRPGIRAVADGLRGAEL